MHISDARYVLARLRDMLQFYRMMYEISILKKPLIEKDLSYLLLLICCQFWVQM